MSKERELLKKAVQDASEGTMSLSLYNEIEELLAQPECDTLTDKPTATAMAVMPNGTYVSNVYDAYEEGRRSLCEAVASQPEHPPMTQREMYQRGYAAAERDLKREPLSDEGIFDIGYKAEQDNLTPRQGLEEYKKGYAKAEDDLKLKPLSDERLEFLVDKYHGYPKTLCRVIEKAHGIGGGDA